MKSQLTVHWASWQTIGHGFESRWEPRNYFSLLSHVDRYPRYNSFAAPEAAAALYCDQQAATNWINIRNSSLIGFSRLLSVLGQASSLGFDSISTPIYPENEPCCEGRHKLPTIPSNHSGSTHIILPKYWRDFLGIKQEESEHRKSCSFVKLFINTVADKFAFKSKYNSSASNFPSANREAANEGDVGGIEINFTTNYISEQPQINIAAVSPSGASKKTSGQTFEPDKSLLDHIWSSFNENWVHSDQLSYQVPVVEEETAERLGKTLASRRTHAFIYPQQVFSKRHIIEYTDEHQSNLLLSLAQEIQLFLNSTSSAHNSPHNPFQSPNTTMAFEAANNTTSSGDGIDPELLLKRKILNIEQIASGILGAIGLMAAILVILVYNYKHKATLSEKIITALACIDFCYNFFLITILSLGKYLTYEKTSVTYKCMASANFFLFAFAVVSSFLLISLITVNRFYAICRPTEYKTTFNKERVRKILVTIFLVAFCQASTNAVWVWVTSDVIKMIIDYEFIFMLDINVSVASALMCLVYVKVLLKFAEQRKRLSSHATRATPNSNTPSHTSDKSNQPKSTNANTTDEVSCSRLLSPNEALSKGSKTRNVSDSLQSTPSTNLLVPPKSTVVFKIDASKASGAAKAADAMKRRRRSNNSDRVTFTLFLISVVFMVCVCPFIVDFNYQYFANQMFNIHLSLGIRMLFQINFLANPVIYFATSKIFRARTLEIIGYFCPRLEKFLRTTKLFKNCIPDDNLAASPNVNNGRSYAKTERTNYQF